MLLRVLQQPEHKWQWLKPSKGGILGTERLVAADALEEAGRHSEAKLLRKPINIAVHNGQIEPAVKAWREAFFATDAEADDLHEYIQQHGPGATANYIINNYDYGEGDMRPEPAHGTGDRTYRHGDYILSWHPSGMYVGLQQEQLIPKSQAKSKL